MTASRLAIVPVRDGVLPSGGADATVEAGGSVLVVGTGATDAADELRAVLGPHLDSVEMRVAETEASFAALAASLADAIAEAHVVILPASPDGRDLAPLLAYRLDRPLLTGAIAVTGNGATCSRWGGRVLDELAVDSPFVVTLQPNVIGLGADVRGALTSRPSNDDDTGRVDERVVELDVDHALAVPESIEVLPPDLATMDLAEADRIVGGGAGLDDPKRFDQLASIAAALGAAMGGTRVITDRGWIAHERQIGTTGVAVAPKLYVSFGISGAVQHTAGLGDPEHVIAVNTDPHCPMMQLADLAIVADANATLDELSSRLAAAEDKIESVHHG